MTTSEMVRNLCEKQNISLAELARKLNQSPQNFFKKLKRESLSLEELKTIADVLEVRYEQIYIASDGDYISTANEWTCKNQKGGNKMYIKEKCLKYLEMLEESIRNAIKDYYDEVINNAISRERDFGIQKNIETLLDLDVEDDEIIQYLGKYWEMGIREASDSLVTIKTIIHPKNELRYYMKKQGYTDKEIHSFIISYYVGPELRTNHELWKLSPPELMEYLQKKKMMKGKQDAEKEN